MSFHFERLILYDWLAYEGKVTVEFGPPQDGRNLWVIYGMNGAGKTSLLRAIQWVFHGKMPDRYVKDCFNRNAVRAGRNELSVIAEFLFNGQHYRLIRRAKADVSDGQLQEGYPRTSVELAVNNQTQQEAGIYDTLEQILPRECQRFFFFDGLEIKEYASPHSEQTRDAIERVLGIPEVRNLEHDLDRLIGELSAERDRLLADREEYETLLELKIEAEFHLDSAKDTFQGLKEKRNNLEQLIAELQQRADRLEQVKDERQLLKGYKRQEADLRDRLNNYDNELRSRVTVVTRRMLLPLLRQRAVRLETEVSQVERVALKTADIEAQQRLIEDLLTRVECICGRELTSPATAHLEQLLVDLDDQAEKMKRIKERSGSLRTQATLKGRLDSLIQRIEDEPTAEEIEAALMTKYKLSIQHQELEQEITRLEDKLAEHGDVEVSEVYSLLGERRTELRHLEERIEEAEDEVSKAEREVQKRERELNAVAQNLPQQARLVATLERTKAVHTVANELVERIVALRHESVEHNLTTIFRSITNKKEEYDRIDLGQDYTPKVTTKAGNVVPNDELSAGEKEVVAFSFIAGLNLSTNTSAPLVMDTPFGHLDIQHRDGLLEALPKLPCQAVLLATDRDLPKEDLPKLNYCLGGRLEIVRDQVRERSFIEEME